MSNRTTDLNLIDPSGALGQVAERLSAVVAAKPGLPRASGKALRAIIESTIAEIVHHPESAVWIARRAKERCRLMGLFLENVEQTIAPDDQAPAAGEAE